MRFRLQKLGVLAVFLGLSLGLPNPASADLFDELDEETGPGTQSAQQEQDEFRKFVEQRDAEYNAYKEEILREFEAYKKIVMEERGKYQSRLAKRWDDPVLSSQKVWVDYSPDLKRRGSVDFEKETITIEMPVETGDGQEAASDEVLRAALTELVTKNKAEAFKEDVVAQAVEKRSKQEIEHLVTAEVRPMPILLSYLIGAAEATAQEIQAIVDYMLDNKQVVTETDAAGRNIQKVEVPLSVPPQITEKVAKVAKPGKSGQLPAKAQVISGHVESYAQREELEQALIFAVIETESAFNPMAKSAIPAYGLMQIVPKSAGMDVTKKLFGKEQILSSSYLYNSEQNIEIGTSYLNILYYRYLRKIDNPESRLYCAIAAYNTGAGNVAKAFTGNRKLGAAIPLINQRTPAEVYEQLRKELPYEETRKYLVKVNDRIRKYEALGL